MKKSYFCLRDENIEAEVENGGDESRTDKWTTDLSQAALQTDPQIHSYLSKPPTLVSGLVIFMLFLIKKIISES